MSHLALVPFVPPLTGHPAARRQRPQSLVHTLALALVFATVATSGLVFIEPAPVDALTIALIVGLPLVGLVAWKRMLAGYAAVWMAIAASGFVAALFAYETGRAAGHIAISVYLYLAAVIFASFVARNPQRHARLILDAYLVAALAAALAGIAGYFDLVPGAAETLTLHGRASGTFKDPNVLGSFLVPALVYVVHLWLERPGGRALLAAAAGGILALAILLTFSRGAWAAALLALSIHWYLSMATATTGRQRLQLMALPMAAGLAGLVVVGAALQNDDVSKLLDERASLTQSYDLGAEGRFGGQLRALELIVESPLGIGALEFTPGFLVAGNRLPKVSEGRALGDDVHNSYLTMFLSSGWLGGLLYVAIVAATIGLGLAHALRRTATRPLFLVAYAALTAILLEGLVIDIDHWRHVHLLLGLVWGLMAGDPRAVRRPRIVADRRPVLMREVLVIPPSWRGNRLVRALPRRARLTGFPEARRRPALPRRAPRIAGSMPRLA